MVYENLHVGEENALSSDYAFLDYTHWDSVGKFIGNGFNGLVDKLDWKGLGHNFAQKWNAVFETAYNAFKTFDWKKLGDSLAEYVMTIVRDFDFKNIAGTLSELAKGLLDTIIGFFEGIDWREVGNKIWDDIVDFVTNIDYAGIIERAAEGVGAAIGGLFALVVGFAEGVLKDIYDWFYDQMYDGGEFTIEGLWLGFLEALGNIGNWIKENIFQPFIDGFKKAFGIESPSKVMKTQGGYIIQGLLNGIKEWWTGLKEDWKKKKDELIETYKKIKEEFKKKGIEIINGIKNGIVEKWNTFKSWWEAKKKAVVDTFKNVLTDFKNKGRDIINGIKNGIVEKWDLFKTYWTNRKDEIINVFSDIKEKMKNVGKDIINGIIEGIKELWETLKGWAQSIKDMFKIKVDKPEADGASSSSASAASANSYNTYNIADIPGYATGQVIPRTMRQHLAILGDNNRETEVVSPISTMKEAFIEAMTESGMLNNKSMNGNLTINVQVGNSVIGKQVVSWAEVQRMASGKNPLLLGRT